MRFGTIAKPCPIGNSFTGLNAWLQRQQIGVRRSGKESAQLLDVLVIGDADEELLRLKTQQAVQVHAQGQVSRTAQARRRNADQWETCRFGKHVKLAGTGRQAFEDEGGRDLRIEAFGDGGLA